MAYRRLPLGRRLPSTFRCRNNCGQRCSSRLTFLCPLSFRCHHVRLNLPLLKPSSSVQAKEAPRVSPKLERDEEGSIKEERTSVLYVMARDAKALKTALEDAGYLDKNYRMTTAAAFQNAGKHIAVPITEEGLAILENGKRPDWCSLVVARGTQKVPFSTAVLGRQKK